MDSWDSYFLNLCDSISTNSKCLSIQRGSILVLDKSIIATGYNGPARGQPQCNRRDLYFSDDKKCPRHSKGFKSGEGLEICPAAHAEVNCIANAARHGVRTKGADMYQNCEAPCSKCLPILINAGIRSVTCTSLQLYDELAAEIINKSDLIIRTFDNEFYRRS